MPKSKTKEFENINYAFHLAPFQEGYVVVKKDSLTFYNKELNFKLSTEK